MIAYSDEEEAFRRFQQFFPDHSVLLVDTYDTLAAIEKIIHAGLRPKSVRLDSGDLVDLSRKVRRRLDQAGLTETRIFAMTSTNSSIADLLPEEPRSILLASAPRSPLPRTPLPLAECTSSWTLHPARLSPNAPNSVKKKSLIPEANKSSARPTLMAALAKTSSHERPNTIQRPSCCSAALCAKASLTPSPNLEQIRDHARHELSRLPELCRRLQNPEPYPVHFSRELEALLEDLRHGLIQPAGKKGA